MALNKRKLRFFYWVLKDLILRYRKALIIGFLFGLILTIAIGRLAPLLLNSFFQPVNRIGLTGSIDPSNLPRTIQSKLSYGLTTIADNDSIQPGIATSWSYADNGKTVQFTLGESIWHDGKDISTTDINYNIQGVVFQIIDKKTINALLPEPYSPFLSIVSQPIFKSGLIGLGEYKLSSLKLKAGLVNTLRLTPATDKSLRDIEYHMFRTESQAIVAFKRGDIDQIEELTSIKDLKEWGTTKIVEQHNDSRIVALYFNLKDPLLSEKTLRQALAYQIPDLGTPRLTSPIPKSSWAFSDATRSYTDDPEQATKLLNEIELPADFTSFTLTTFPQYVELAQQIATAFSDAGIPTVVKVENSVGRDYQMLLSAQDVPPDPDQYPFWHSQQTETNITGYTNLRVDRILELGRTTVDLNERKKLYADFQKFVMEDVPAIFLFHPTLYTVSRN